MINHHAMIYTLQYHSAILSFTFILPTYFSSLGRVMSECNEIMTKCIGYGLRMNKVTKL